MLERWAPAGGPVPPEHVHVLPLPGKDAPREQIWHSFAGLLGLDARDYDLSTAFPNESMGVVEAETLRRINEHLGGFTKAIDRGTYIRTFLGDERLVPRGGERYWPAEDQVEDCRRRGWEAVAFVREQGYDVIGDAGRPAGAGPAARAPPSGLGHRRRGRRRSPSSWWRRCSATYATCATSDAGCRRELDVPSVSARTLARLRDRIHGLRGRRTECRKAMPDGPRRVGNGR